MTPLEGDIYVDNLNSIRYIIEVIDSNLDGVWIRKLSTKNIKIEDTDSFLKKYKKVGGINQNA